MNQVSSRISAATTDDAEALAKLIDIAGEGIPSWLWSQSAAAGQSPLHVGRQRARRDTGGFSYKNAMVARRQDNLAGMVLSYPIIAAPDDDPDGLPAPIAPFVSLEKHAVGTWYVNALAVFPAYQGGGLGRLLMDAAEDAACQHGFDRTSIQVYAQNHGAVRLYTGLGYDVASREPVREHPCYPYYTGDVLLMVKHLGSARVGSPGTIGAA